MNGARLTVADDQELGLTAPASGALDGSCSVRAGTQPTPQLTLPPLFAPRGISAAGGRPPGRAHQWVRWPADGPEQGGLS